MTIALELLAPAGNAEIGIAAIDHGADAVYIGAPRFSARANAGVDATDIARLIRHAHLYYARVYVALNTILTDDEIPEALDVIREIYDLGADGLIIQDPGLLEMDLPPIPLIASTQMHNDTPEKIRFLEDVGFKRVILARELSLEEIAAIRQKTRIELECFVHGALCVSYSGQCYMSQAVTGRSGNRGVCAQPCRSRYTLTDGDGNSILSDKFLLSLKDLNRMNDIPDLVAAGITSFKIEGRYKEIDYVKNVTAAYSRALDAFIRKSSELSPQQFRQKRNRIFAGSGEDIQSRIYPILHFRPQREDCFHGYAEVHRPSCWDGYQSGEGIFQDRLSRTFKTEMGFAFSPKKENLSGFRVERVENSKIFPNTMKDLAEGIPLYRNHNIALTTHAAEDFQSKADRCGDGFQTDGDTVRLAARDEDGNHAELIVAYAL